jgi:multiple sugar transport system permease protein
MRGEHEVSITQVSTAPGRLNDPVSAEVAAVAAPSPPRRRRRLGRLRRIATPYLFVAPAALFMLLFLVYPVLFNIDISFRDLTAGNLLSGGAAWVGLDNYRGIFHDQIFWAAVRHSLVFTVASIVFQVGIGLALALFYNREFPGSQVMRTMYLIGYAVPIVVIGSVFKWVLDGQFGVLNWALRSVGVIDSPVAWLDDPKKALGAVIMINIWLGIPFNMVVILAGLRTLPGELYEAASLDGAGPFQRFRYITLPLLRPTMLAVGILGTIFTFKAFDVIWITTKGGPANATDVLPTLAYSQVFQQFLFGRGAAMLNVMFVMLFALSLMYLWYLRREERP